MASFHEARFPDSISKGSSGGPRRRTDIVTLRSGHEERNAVWADSRRFYDAGLGLRNIDDVYEVAEFWEARFGNLYGFRWKDWLDYKSCPPGTTVTSTDQLVGTPATVGEILEIVKRYTSEGHTYTRRIYKPIATSIVAQYNGVEVSDDILIDQTTGLLRLLRPLEPGQSLYIGFEFDVPVRFDQDSLTLNIEQFNAGSIPQINLIELRVDVALSPETLALDPEVTELAGLTPMSEWLDICNRVDVAVNSEWGASDALA